MLGRGTFDYIALKLLLGNGGSLQQARVKLFVLLLHLPAAASCRVMQHFLSLSPKFLTLPPPSLCGRSLGVLVFECCYGYPPFHARTILQTFYNITMKAPAFPTESKVRLKSQEGKGQRLVLYLH